MRPRARLALAMVACWGPAAAWAAQPHQAAHVALVTPRYLTAGGSAEVLAAMVRDGAGRPVADGLPVAFTASLGIVVSPPVVDTRDGWAVASMSPATESGFAQVDAVADGGRAQTILWVRPGPAAELTLDAAPARLAAGARAVLTGRAWDTYGNPAEGDAARWEVSGGTLLASQPRVDHGRLRADFVAGPGPATATVRVAAGTAEARTVITVDDTPARPPGPLWLPLVLGDLRLPGTCSDVLENGSFELDTDGDGVPEPWQSVAGGGVLLDPDTGPVTGLRAVRLVGDPDRPAPALRQTVQVVPGARDGQLWLWARGAPAGGGLRLAVWSTVVVGTTPTRVPVLIQHLSLPDPAWLRLAFRLPMPPGGTTSVEVSPWAEGAAKAIVDLDDVQLNVCW